MDGVGAVPLERTEWTLVELDGAPVHSPAPHIVFDPAESRVHGSGGCNRFAGSYERDGEGLRFSPLASTRIACGEEVMQQEAAFFRALAATVRFELDSGSLVLHAADRPVARMQPKGRSPMYARLVRFEGADPEALKRELEQMGEQIRSGTGPSEMDQAQMQTMRDAIKRVLVLADTEKGSSAMIAFCDTEEDVRRIDEMFNQMSPGDEGGKRQSVDIYEVAIDEQTGG